MTAALERLMGPMVQGMMECPDCKGFGTIIENIEADWTPPGIPTKIYYTPCARCHSYGRIAHE